MNLTKPIFIFTVLVISLLLNACQPEPISFNEQVRSILNDNCLACHGGVKQAGGFSLLFREEALDTTDSGVYAIIPGDHTNSEMYKRLVHHDPEMRMPLEADPLSKEEIDLIARWIDEGAGWELPWAYRPVEAPELPDASDNWAANDIDRFVYRRLAETGLKPESSADPAVLLRRVSLDLTGLPPTIEELDAFLKDTEPGAYERAVDRLLASPRFGERWAAMWLDLARYADSKGYEKDAHRNIWRYRDWVIEAFNRDMPFDQFTIEQLAGDLLEVPTGNQLLATAFHRNTNTNTEGGTDDEEFRTVAVIDRLNTTFEAWQGVTMSCVQCHSHPYDPFRHEEFYGAMAFFNNSADADQPDERPRHKLLSPGQKVRKLALEEKIKKWRSQGDTLSDAFVKQVADLKSIKPGPVPVMRELPSDSSRKTHVFERGNWLVHGREVQPGVPASLSLPFDNFEPNRLGLARWLVDPENPLTARVIVNRFWAQLYGRGIVETLEDFGTQGDPPSHPELLDYLAARFVFVHKWSVKSLLREIVLSDTYRQSSSVSAEKLERDPYNRLLSRGPRFRLSAEQIRDQALLVSGLLSKKMYGPSVMPYQPPGVWNVIRHTARWQTSPGEDRYRRALYTFSRKTIPYPSLETFDRPSREFCVSRRIPTNTPLQAMVTLNDPVYVEAARALADRMQEKWPENIDAQLRYGYRLAMLREPDSHRLGELRQLYDKTIKLYEEAETVRMDLPAGTKMTAEKTALLNVSSVILNLDGFLVKN